jgi:two-component system KDP operon response regulator KdpE
VSRLRPVVVVIEDDAKLRRLLRSSLQDAGMEVREAASGQLGLDLAATKKPDLILLDLGLPDIDGVEIIRQLRQWWSGRPLIILSGRDAEAAKVAALELGADDYVTKPFGLPELLARVRAALRRAARLGAKGEASAFEARGVVIDLQRREVTRDGKAVALTPNEYRILAVLVKHAGRLVTTEALVREIWGPDATPSRRHYLRGYLLALRQKLEEQPARPSLLLTEAGVGYRLAVDA